MITDELCFVSDVEFVDRCRWLGDEAGVAELLIVAGTISLPCGGCH